MIGLSTQVFGRHEKAISKIQVTRLIHLCEVLNASPIDMIHNLEPSRRDWRRVRDHYATLFDMVPESRILTPDHQVWIDASVVAGTLARTQNFSISQRKECLNDTLIFLTAAKVGMPVLTANRDEFDLIQQIASDGRFIWC